MALTTCTYSVDPTAPFASGVGQRPLTPTPSKFKPSTVRTFELPIRSNRCKALDSIASLRYGPVRPSLRGFSVPSKRSHTAGIGSRSRSGGDVTCITGGYTLTWALGFCANKQEGAKVARKKKTSQAPGLMDMRGTYPSDKPRLKLRRFKQAECL